VDRGGFSEPARGGCIVREPGVREELFEDLSSWLDMPRRLVSEANIKYQVLGDAYDLIL
jgi:hypothetical protein